MKIKIFLNLFLNFVYIIKFICDLKCKKSIKKVSHEKSLKNPYVYFAQGTLCKVNILTFLPFKDLLTVVLTIL